MIWLCYVKKKKEQMYKVFLKVESVEQIKIIREFYLKKIIKLINCFIFEQKNETTSNYKYQI